MPLASDCTPDPTLGPSHHPTRDPTSGLATDPPPAPRVSSIDRPVLTVASVPAAHPYVRGLGLDRVGVRLLGDPPVPGAPPGQWWPPVMLDADWVGTNADHFDLLHLHFGAESFGLGALGRWLDALACAGRPLVHTVHDLDHPQLHDGSHHRAQLDLIVPRAAELITLTAGAAAEIRQRWGRPVTVIAHPRMLNDAWLSPLSSPSAPASARVAVHLRDLRPNVDGPGTTRGLTGAVERLRRDGLDVRGEVHLFDRVRDPRAAAQVEREARQASHTEVVRGPRPSDRDLVTGLNGVYASVLPYRHGTHSGWAELCWDLGVPVLGAPVGHIAQQHPDPGWFHPVDVTDPARLAEVLARLRPPAADARRRLMDERRVQRGAEAAAIAAGHRTVFDRARA